MRAHGRGFVLLRSFPRSSLETVLVPFTLLRACVPRLPPRAAEPASPSTMLLQARKCMRTRQSTATDSRDPPEAQQRRSAGRAVPRLAAARPAERRGEPRCREPAEPRRRGRVDPGRYRIGAGSRRRHESSERTCARSDRFWANFKFVSIFAADDFKLLSLLLPQNPATALAAHARARKLAG